MNWRRTKLLVTASAVVLSIVCAIDGTRAFAEEPATQPARGWFDPIAKPAPTTLPSGASIDDPEVFARLYPELARVDKAVRAATPRIVFDSLESKGKPQLKLPRMDSRGGVFTEASYRAFDVGRRREPFVQVLDERRIRIATIEARQKGASLCLDIETLPLDVRISSADDIDRSVRMLAQAVGWVRAQDPNLRVFLYSGFPAGDAYVGGQVAGAATTRPDGETFPWWKGNQSKFIASYEAWQKANAMLHRAEVPGEHEAAASLGSLFDGTCPSLYLPYEPTNLGATEGIPAWVRSQVDESRRYGKPVYPFVSYYLFDVPKIVPLNQWTLMIREIVTHADGVVLWDGPNVWDDRKTLRTRIATLLAERKGAMTDAELYVALRKELPGDAELKAMLTASPAAGTQQSR
jgi:hypothetical protein